jgi:hypothetical protein
MLGITFNQTHRLQGWWLENCSGIQPVLGQCQISTKRTGSPSSGNGASYPLLCGSDTGFKVSSPLGCYAAPTGMQYLPTFRGSIIPPS